MFFGGSHVTGNLMLYFTPYKGVVGTNAGFLMANGITASVSTRVSFLNTNLYRHFGSVQNDVAVVE